MQQRLKTLFLIIIAPLFLASCEEKHEDLDQWLETVQSKPVPAVRPLPDVKPYKAFDYAAEDEHSPFMKVVPETEVGTLTDLQGCGINDPKPDLNRRKEELERMPLNTLSMVGAISDDAGKLAIIRDESSGLLYRVKEGNFLGLDNGRIMELNETLIKLYEVVPNGRGCWESRTQTLELGQ